MGVPICLCHNYQEYIGNINIPCCDLFLDNNKEKALNNKQDSIILPNGNNMNLYYESKINLNNVDDYFNESLSPIAKAKKSNINNFQMNGNYDSSNNYKNNSNIETNKIYEPLKFKKETRPLQQESYVKEESISQEEKNSNSKENHNEEIINEFDKQIKIYAEYISEEQFNDAQNEIIKDIERNLEPFESNFKRNNDFFERPPLLFKNDNSIYKGTWNIKGEKSGFGIFIDSQGNKYIGEWEKDKFNGKGRILSVNGDYYEGEVIKGLIEGNGVFYSSKDNYKYIGEFKENKFHGKGRIIYEKDNIVYEGEFKEGYKHGLGKLVFEDNSYYDGNFENNNYNGKGKFSFSDGRTYNGDWEQNKMVGKGIFTWENGSKYKGYYKNNMRDGNGIYSFGCNLYDGNWVNGLPHGKGTLLFEGLRIEAFFRYGKILEMIDGKGANKELTEKLTLGSRVNLKSEFSFKENFDSRYSKKGFEKQRTVGNKRDLMKKISRDKNMTNKSSKDKKIKFKEKDNKNQDKNKTKEKEKVKIKSIFKKHSQ